MANRRLQPADNLIGPAVTETVNHLDLDAVDAAAVKLAQRYAAAIDAAARIAADLDDLSDDESLAKRVAALAAKVEAQCVLDRLGPKLLEALEALGATPRARASRKGGASAPAQGRLAALRSVRGPA